MDALQRSQQRQQEARNSVRPLPVASQQSGTIDLTGDDAFGPLPLPQAILTKASQHGQHQHPAGASGTARDKGWHAPGRYKHSGPSKVKMLDSASFYNPAPPNQAFSGNGFSAFSAARPGMAHDGVTFVRQATAAIANFRKKITAQSVDLSQDAIDDEEPPPPLSYADPAMSATEREQQLQDMLSSMVNPPDVGDIDLEKAKNVKGLRCELLPHQVAGLLWMKEREGGRYKGGILADDMGLGKTVQTLALIIANSPTSADRTIDTIRSVPGEVTKKGKKKKDEIEDMPEKVFLKSRTTLILAPLAVIRQWERESKEKTSPNLRVLVHHGSARAKTAAVFASYDIVVTTYTTAASEWGNHSGVSNKMGGKRSGKGKKGPITIDSSDELDSSAGSQSSDEDEPLKKSPSKPVTQTSPAPLFEASWLRVVLDEAQNIKNYRTKASIACAALSRNALSKWCLSGTPIQNDALEMFSLIRFLGIPPFNEYSHFREKIADPLKSNNQNRVNWGMKRLCVILRTIMLRRTKDSTHDGKPLIVLPARTVNVVSCDFDTELERSFYDNLESQVKKKLEDAEGEGQKVSQMANLLMLLRLRQACSHPALLNRHVRDDAGALSAPLTATPGESDGMKDNVGKDDDDDGLADLLAGLSVKSKNCDRCSAILPPKESQQKHCADCIRTIEDERVRGIDWTGKASTKIRVMLGLLDEIAKERNGEKTIVFSQFTSFLDLVEPFLRQKNHRFVRYDGSMNANDRERSLDTIRSSEDIRIILISFKAGSTGLNLTCCSRVILMDLWWNPQLEEQAFDRSHRLGQTRPVHIYKLTITRSVEERILELQAKKRALAKAALEGSKFSKANKLDKKELLYLFAGAPV